MHFLDALTEDDWKYCLNEKIISSDLANYLKEELRYLTAGMLLFY
jgi:hypothetical protein